MNEKLPTILLYHNISLPYNNKISKDRTTISLDAFKTHIGSLLADGWIFVSLLDFLVYRYQENYAFPEIPLLTLTFDDGYADLLHVIPFLKEHNIPATLFILINEIGKSNSWNPRAYSILKHLSLSNINMIMRLGYDVQYHGTDHHRLTKFTFDELIKRFKKGQHTFKTLFNREASIIAYPYGSFNEEVILAAQQFFEFGLSVTQGKWDSKANHYTINRLEVTNWMTPEFLVTYLSLERKLRLSYMRANIPKVKTSSELKL